MGRRFFIFLSILIPLTTFAQGPIYVPEHILDSIARASQTSSCPLDFGEKVLDAGEINEGHGIRTFVFRFRNRTGAKVKIDQISTSCSCLGAVADHCEVAPGDSGKITAAFNPHRRIGPFEQTVSIYTDGGAFPSGTLTLRGSVLPEDGHPDYSFHAGNLMFTRRRISFGDVIPGTLRQERIACYNAGEAPLRIEPVSHLWPEGFSLRTEPEVIPPSSEADIVVELDASLIGRSSGKAVLVFGPLDCPPSERSLEIDYNLIDK